MKKLVLIIIPILLVSCSKTPEVIGLTCKEDGKDRVHSVRIDLLTSTMTIVGRDKETTLNITATENEITHREIKERDEQKLIRQWVIDRRTLRMTSLNYFENQDKSTETISKDSGQCKLLEIPERQI